MKQIPLTQGMVAFVDDADHAQIKQYGWYAHRDGYVWYAHRRRGKHTSAMHREILGLQRYDGKQVDHINRNGLDNRRSNIRLCSRSQNQYNSCRGNKWGYRGLAWNRRIQRWQVYIKNNGAVIYLGSFKNRIAAAEAYDKGALRFHGGFAQLNFSKGVSHD